MVPIGVLIILILVALRDFRSPASTSSATMLLTYLFALGATHLVFVTLPGSRKGLDWKVPYFLFVLLVAVGVDYNVFLMTRLPGGERTRSASESRELARLWPRRGA